MVCTKIQKEVKTSIEKEVKKNILINITSSIQQGLTFKQICEKYNLSKQNLNYYIKKLKDQNVIEKIGYGVWKVKNGSKVTADPKAVRGHAFMWKVKLPTINNWDKRKEILSKNNINYKEVGLKKTPRIIFKDRKIWLCNNTLIIYEPFSYFGKNSVESKKYAIYNLINLLEKLESKFKCSFKINKGYEFTVRREHYSLINNCLAIQCNKNKEKINVSNKDGSIWFIIDNSYNLNEAETIHKKTALTDNLGIQNYFNSHKKTNYQVTPEFVLNMMHGIQKNQEIFAENMKTHIKAIQDLSSGVNKLTSLVTTVTKKNTINKQTLNSQTTLNNY